MQVRIEISPPKNLSQKFPSLVRDSLEEKKKTTNEWYSHNRNTCHKGTAVLPPTLPPPHSSLCLLSTSLHQHMLLLPHALTSPWVFSLWGGHHLPYGFLLLTLPSTHSPPTSQQFRCQPQSPVPSHSQPVTSSGGLHGNPPPNHPRTP